MQLYYALYDPATSKDGAYWTWFAGGLQKDELNGFYNDIAVKHLPTEPNKLESNGFWGGVACYRDWTVLYRYYNGGFDNKGRPGRYVILTAWIPAEETIGINISPIFDNDTFKRIAETSQERPASEPSSLSESWTGKKKPLNLQLPDKEFTKPFPSAEDAINVFANIPANRNAWVKITKQEIVLTADANPGPTKEELLQQKMVYLVSKYEEQIAYQEEKYEVLQQNQNNLEQSLQVKESEISNLQKENKEKNSQIQKLEYEINQQSLFQSYPILSFLLGGIICLLVEIILYFCQLGLLWSIAINGGVFLVILLLYFIFHVWLEWL
ncbi:MAG: hypothetical protein LBJ67_11845 [Planctomycetaceae bacterium]|jgi:hypothetical protein|nr:hypothetical protein [Planctomycetaceae bacterium]